MKTRSPQVCEIKVDGVWREATLAEAHGPYRMAPKRCPACHGQVMVNGAYANERSMSLTHRKAHSGCSLKPEKYSGTPSLHPNALT